MKERLKKIPSWLKWTVKWSVSFVIIYLLVTKIDWIAFNEVMQKAKFTWLILAASLFTVSKWLSAERFRLLILYDHPDFPFMENLRLYWKSMYYNLLLPGGISGDAYKMKVLNERFGYGLKTLVRLVLIDRLSGLLALFQWMVVFALFIDRLKPFQFALGFSFVALTVLTFQFLRIFKMNSGSLKYQLAYYSVGVQGAQVLSAAFIIYGLNQDTHLLSYLLLFLASSLAAMIPVTIGGAGARELCFMYGAPLVGGSATEATAVGFVFYLISSFVSLMGIFWVISESKGMFRHSPTQ